MNDHRVAGENRRRRGLRDCRLREERVHSFSNILYHPFTSRRRVRTFYRAEEVLQVNYLRNKYGLLIIERCQYLYPLEVTAHSKLLTCVRIARPTRTRGDFSQSAYVRNVSIAANSNEDHFSRERIRRCGEYLLTFRDVRAQ